MMEYIKIALAAVTGALAYVFGPWDALMITLVVMIVLDVLTGFIKAGVGHELCSSTCWKGLLKKLLIFILVSVGVLLDRLMNMNGAVRAAVSMFYIANEGISILENMGEMGVPLPAFLKKMLLKLHQDSDPAGTTEE